MLTLLYDMMTTISIKMYIIFARTKTSPYNFDCRVIVLYAFSHRTLDWKNLSNIAVAFPFSLYLYKTKETYKNEIRSLRRKKYDVDST